MMQDGLTELLDERVASVCATTERYAMTIAIKLERVSVDLAEVTDRISSGEADIIAVRSKLNVIHAQLSELEMLILERQATGEAIADLEEQRASALQALTPLQEEYKALAITLQQARHQKKQLEKFRVEYEAYEKKLQPAINVVEAYKRALGSLAAAHAQLANLPTLLEPETLPVVALENPAEPLAFSISGDVESGRQFITLTPSVKPPLEEEVVVIDDSLPSLSEIIALLPAAPLRIDPRKYQHVVKELAERE
jgi:hypothetical protein